MADEALTPRQLAGRKNAKLRGPLSPAGREALRHHALQAQPWSRSTGPRTPSGKARSRQNALRHGNSATTLAPDAIREAEALLSRLWEPADGFAALRLVADLALLSTPRALRLASRLALAASQDARDAVASARPVLGDQRRM